MDAKNFNCTSTSLVFTDIKPKVLQYIAITKMIDCSGYLSCAFKQPDFNSENVNPYSFVNKIITATYREVFNRTVPTVPPTSTYPLKLFHIFEGEGD